MKVNPIYINGEYYRKNPTWDVKDSPWKATQVYKLMRLYNLKPRTVADVGCGAGQVLVELKKLLRSRKIKYFGFDISPQAIKLCRRIRESRISFRRQDILKSNKHFDLILVLDIIEHIEDYYGFLRRLRHKADYLIYNLPLDISSWSVFRESKTITDARRRTGHLHHFTKDIALDVLRQTGFDVVAWRYGRVNNSPVSIRRRLMALMRTILFAISPDLSVRLLGGASLLVLARKKNSN